MKKRQKSNILVSVLFVVYLALLVWIILFKLQFSIHELDTIRRVNLIPFYYENEIGIGFHLKEALGNVVIFIPFGIYLSMTGQAWKTAGKVLFIFGASFTLEAAQYILAIGGSDITDIITNTFGGFLGLGVYFAAEKLFGRERAERVFTILAAVVTVIVIGGLAFLLAVN